MIKRTRIYSQLLNSTAWRRLRAAALERNPLCERCKAAGYITAATEVHHLRPVDSVKGRDAKAALAYNPGNLQCLCHRCHVEVHTRMGKWAARAKTKPRGRAATNWQTETLKKLYGK